MVVHHPTVFNNVYENNQKAIDSVSLFFFFLPNKYVDSSLISPFSVYILILP